MSNWAPLVHGRTYRVDFRPNMLVVPEWFGMADIAWAREFFRAATRSAEALDGNPRWLLFKNEHFLVAAVVCMANAVSTNMTRDRAATPGSDGRELYVGLGWVTTDLNAEPPPMDLASFEPLYEFVRRRWDAVGPDDDIHNAAATEMVFPRPASVVPVKLNREPQAVRVWADSERAALWYSASASDGPVSLAIGIDRPKDAEDSPLLNVTLAGEETRETLFRSSSRSLVDPSWPTADHEFPRSKSPCEPRRQSVPAYLLPRIVRIVNSVIGLFGGQAANRFLLRRERPSHSAEPASDDAIPAGFRRKTKPKPGGAAPTHEDPRI